MPQIGKVVVINEATVKVQWLKGEYDEQFRFGKVDEVKLSLRNSQKEQQWEESI